VDVLNLEAITALRNTLQGLLPSDPLPLLAIHQAHIKPIGIGGFVGLHDDPHGELIGRSVRAAVLVSVSGADAGQLRTRYAAVVDALLVPGHGELRAQGILKLILSEPAGQPGDADSTRDLQLDVLFEYIKQPEAAEEVIDTIPLDVVLG
jgi:hypothetical protein